MEHLHLMHAPIAWILPAVKARGTDPPLSLYDRLRGAGILQCVPHSQQGKLQRKAPRSCPLKGCRCSILDTGSEVFLLYMQYSAGPVDLPYHLV